MKNEEMKAYFKALYGSEQVILPKILKLLRIYLRKLKKKKKPCDTFGLAKDSWAFIFGNKSLTLMQELQTQSVTINKITLPLKNVIGILTLLGNKFHNSLYGSLS